MQKIQDSQRREDLASKNSNSFIPQDRQGKVGPPSVGSEPDDAAEQQI